MKKATTLKAKPDKLEKAFIARDAAMTEIKTLLARQPKPSPAERKARQQASEDDRLLNDFQRRIAQLAALTATITIAGENADHGGGDPEGWRVLSIAMDLAQQCRDDYDGRLGDLATKGMKAELAERLAPADAGKVPS